ncbi:MAG: hypothetical protein RI973_462 [Bacteroidota bacterium]|jgi:hypothetical protein
MNKRKSILVAAVFSLAATLAQGQQAMDQFKYEGGAGASLLDNAVRQHHQFNGYTNYWHNSYREWIRYGSLFKMAVPNIEYTIAQSKADVAEDLGIPGLKLQEGFLAALVEKEHKVLIDPSPETLNKEAASGNVLVFTAPDAPAGKLLLAKIPQDPWPARLKNHQANAADYQPVQAFYLNGPSSRIFVVSAADSRERLKVAMLLSHTQDIVNTYDLKKGWFGTETLLKSVTCMFGHPVEVMGKAMNEGCSFAVFQGYMDFWAQKEMSAWVNQVGNPLVVDVGTYNIFGCKDYDGLQLQDMGGEEGWIKFTKEKGGYIFRNVYDPKKDDYKYDGYIAVEGNKEQIDKGDTPFVAYTGPLEGGAETSMVLFVPKGNSFTREEMWKAILDVRSVAVMPQGLLMGPKKFRDALNALLLDRVYLEGLFNDRLNLDATVEGYELVLQVNNTLDKPVSGNVRLTLPASLSLEGAATASLSLPAGSNKTLRFRLVPSAAAMANANPVLVSFEGSGIRKQTMAVLDLPRAISMHTLLYGHAPAVDFPVSVHNFSGKSSFPVSLKVVNTVSNKTVYQTEKIANAPTSGYAVLDFSLPLAAGSYKVTVSALGQEAVSQLGVGAQKGNAYLYEDDLNADGIQEYRMENDQVRLTLIATGARVIEYYIKEKDDNALFKLWPEKPEDHDRPFRRRGFYPYGGFEDFLGQASMETHQVYDVEVLKKEGDYVQVRMSTDYFGNRLEKIYTLYGDSPLLEVRYALNFRNPEANVIGPQPILALGEEHGTEDVYTVPDLEGMKEFRMRPEEYYGQIINLKEGWNAGYDSKEKIAFLSAYPVEKPLFLHMWMNHDRNPDSHYFYNEFQPWVPIEQKTTMYFTFYMWGQGGHWLEALNALKERNLISTR